MSSFHFFNLNFLNIVSFLEKNNSRSNSLWLSLSQLHFIWLWWSILQLFLPISVSCLLVILFPISLLISNLLKYCYANGNPLSPFSGTSLCTEPSNCRVYLAVISLNSFFLTNLYYVFSLSFKKFFSLLFGTT